MSNIKNPLVKELGTASHGLRAAVWFGCAAVTACTLLGLIAWASPFPLATILAAPLTTTTQPAVAIFGYLIVLTHFLPSLVILQIGVNRARRHLASRGSGPSTDSRSSRPMVVFLRPFAVGENWYSQRELTHIPYAIREALRKAKKDIRRTMLRRISSLRSSIPARRRGAFTYIKKQVMDFVDNEIIVGAIDTSQSVTEDMDALRFSHDEWQSRIRQLLHHAHTVIMAIGERPGATRELEWLISDGLMEKVLIILPHRDVARREAIDALFSKLSYSGDPLPFLGRRVLGIHFSHLCPTPILGAYGARDIGIFDSIGKRIVLTVSQIGRLMWASWPQNMAEFFFLGQSPIQSMAIADWTLIMQRFFKTPLLRQAEWVLRKEISQTILGGANGWDYRES